MGSLIPNIQIDNETTRSSVLQHSGEATAITTGDRTGTTQTLQQRGARMTDHGEEDKSSPWPEPGYQDHTALILASSLFLHGGFCSLRQCLLEPSISVITAVMVLMN